MRRWIEDYDGDERHEFNYDPGQIAEHPDRYRGLYLIVAVLIGLAIWALMFQAMFGTGWV